MKSSILNLGIICVLLSVGQAFAQKMDNLALEKVLTLHTDSISGTPGYWQSKYKQLWMLTITDQNNNRMRIISPIAKVSDLTSEILEKALSANFHSVLDVKYAISDGTMWVAFIHPLKELTDEQVKSAIQQIYYAVITFGESYSSGELVFPGKN